MKRSRKRTVSGDAGLISSRLLTPCRRLGLSARRSMPTARQPASAPTQSITSVPVRTPAPQPEPVVTPQLISAVAPQLDPVPAPRPVPAATVQSIPTQVTQPIPKATSTLAPVSVTSSASAPPSEQNISDDEPLVVLKTKEKVKTPKTVRVKKERKPKTSKKTDSPLTLSQKTASSSLAGDSDDDFEVKSFEKKRKLSRTPSLNRPSKNSQTKLSTSAEIEDIKKRIKLKTDAIENLKITNVNDDTDLKAAIVHWRGACQEALKVLLTSNSRKRSEKITMKELLNLLHIPCDLVKYDTEQMDFI